MNRDSRVKFILNQATGAHMAIGPRSTVTASIGILAAAFGFTSLGTIALRAQQPAQSQNQLADLPDAPVPAAPAGSALDRGEPLSVSYSLEPPAQNPPPPNTGPSLSDRSEEHTSELQSLRHL